MFKKKCSKLKCKCENIIKQENMIQINNPNI